MYFTKGFEVEIYCSALSLHFLFHKSRKLSLELPDGIFITNDFLAAVFMQTLKVHQYKIPDDIAVVGFNNDIISKLVEPTLTTINYPGFDIGEIAATNLIALLNRTENVQKPKKIVVSSKLIVRNSSLKKK